MCHIALSECNEGVKKEFQTVSILESVEDVATLIETFEKVRMKTDITKVRDVMVNEDGFYLFITDENWVDDFDFFGYINSRYSGETLVNCVNARLLFPANLSRGIFEGVLTGELAEEEIPTGFLDEDDMEGIIHKQPRKLFYGKLGVEIPISEEGVIIGRSSKQSDYVIRGNGNVSRKHVKVYKKGNTYFIHNYEPPNGTYIDGLRVKNFDDVKIEEGNVILLADEEFEVR